MKQISREGIQRMITVPQASGGGGGGSFDPTAMGLASEAWVEENYISKAFFNRLFTIHSASSVIDPNDPDEEQTIDSIEALVGLWTEQYLSALGQGSGGGGGGGITLNDPLDAINSAGLSDPVTAGSALVWYGGAWTYSPSARLQVAGLNSSAAVSVTGSVTATSFVRQGGTSAMFLKADGSVDTTVYAAQDWVSQNFITIAFFETLFNAVDTNGTKVNANTTTGIDSIKAMFGFWTNQYLSALGQGSGGGGGGVTLNQPLSSINSAGLGAPSVSGSTLVWNGTTWTYSSSIGDTKNTAGSSAQPSGVQLYLIGASAQATWGVTYSNSGCYIGTDGYLYSGGSKVLTSSAGFVTGVSVNNGNPISPVNGVVALTDIMTTVGGTMTGSLSISGSGSHLSVGGNIGAQGTITSQDYITATGFKTPNGTSAGFLKADGSVDTTSYSTSDTLNTAGAGTLPVAGVLYLVGAPNYNADWQQTYTNSGCYISADGYLYSGGVKVITSTSGLVSGISIGGDTPIEPTNGIVQIPAYPVNTDTLNTAGSTQKPSNVALYLVGASAQATYGQTYSDSGCYISADGYLYSGGVRVLTSGNVVQTITINSGTPISPTNGNININCLTSLSSSDVTTALGYTPAANSSLANYVAKVGDTMSGALSITANTGDLLKIKSQSSTQPWACTVYTTYDDKVWTSGANNNNIYYFYSETKGAIVAYIDTNGYVYATGYKVGSNTGFLKADGSIDNNTYLTSASDTKNTTGATNLASTKLFLIGATAQNTDPVTYSNSTVYIGSDNCLYNFRNKEAISIGSSSALDYVCVVYGHKTSSWTSGVNTACEFYFWNQTNATVATININGVISSNGFKKFGGTSSQFLKADGSVDSNTYLTSASDTKNTAGATNLASTKLFLIGATVQNTDPVTYSNSNLYIDTNNALVNNIAREAIYIGTQSAAYSCIVYNTSATNWAVGATATSEHFYFFSSYTNSEVVQIGKTGVVTAAGFVKSGGTSAQFLKADGSVDSTSYSATDTLNTAGATAQPNSAIYLVGAGSYNSTYAVTYTNSGCYIGTDGCLYSAGSKVMTTASGYVVKTGDSMSGRLSITESTGDAIVLKTSKTWCVVGYQANAGLYWSVGCNNANQFYFWNTNSNSTVAYFSGTGGLSCSTVSTSGQISATGNIGTNGTLTVAGASYNTRGSGRSWSWGGGTCPHYVGNNSTEMYLWTESNIGLTIGTNNAERMRIANGGKIAINSTDTATYQVHVNGSHAAKGYNNISDMRKKNYIDEKSVELWQVAQAPIFTFTWKDDLEDRTVHVGTSAQYWQSCCKEVVSQDGLGFLSVQYDVVALLAAITTAKKVQEHEQRIEELERENKVLWNMIANLKAA